MLRAQGLQGQQSVDFVLWALEGKAKRQVMLLETAQRASDKTILAELKELYGQLSSLAQIRVQFFQCRQKEEESVELYTLRFQELFNRWRTNEPQELTQSEATARDQFVMGLKAGKVQRKLERLVRQRPTLTFAEACTEAQALEKEQGTKEQAQSARVMAPQQRVFDFEDLDKWKESVKNETPTGNAGPAIHYQ